jgi:hypothetical protein
VEPDRPVDEEDVSKPKSSGPALQVGSAPVEPFSSANEAAPCVFGPESFELAARARDDDVVAVLIRSLRRARDP